MSKLSEIKGISEAELATLESEGLHSLEDLLNVCGDKKGRKEFAKKSEIEEKLILRWVNTADLSRIKGVSTQYSDLLEFAGVDTVPELSHRNAKNLHLKIIEVNEANNLVHKIPTESQLENWIAQAKELPRAINY